VFCYELERVGHSIFSNPFKSQTARANCLLSDSLRVYTHTHIHTYIHTHIHTHIHTYTHTNTHKFLSSAFVFHNLCSHCLHTVLFNSVIICKFLCAMSNQKQKRRKKRKKAANNSSKSSSVSSANTNNNNNSTMNSNDISSTNNNRVNVNGPSSSSGRAKTKKKKHANTHTSSSSRYASDKKANTRNLNKNILHTLKCLYAGRNTSFQGVHVEPPAGLSHMASSLQLNCLAPRSKICVLVIGNHSAGKSRLV